MSSQEDLSARTTGELASHSDVNDRYKLNSRAGFNGDDTSGSKNQHSNGLVNPAAGTSKPLTDTTASSSYNAQQQPINDAVTSAFTKTESTMSPELIQLITQNVIQQMQVYQNSQIPSAPPVQPPQPHIATDRPEAFSSFQGSPILDRATVYTPPSPSRPGEESDAESRFTMPNHPEINNHGYRTSREGDVSPRSRNSNEDAILSDSDTSNARPSNLRRASTDLEASVLEKTWGKLFDDDGQGTERLTHFLKGIANHLIEEIEPRRSLVITPDKMQKFYEATRLDERPEIYPWRHVFDDKTSSISRLLRDPGVQVHHHLVQASPSARPDIPGLTPDGFTTWLTLLIQAHPDHEHERLNKILRLMAINHPEERKQRFPAHLPRKLLPDTEDNSISARLSGLMAMHCKIKIDSRHNSTATTNLNTSEFPQSPRRADMPPAPTVEDVPDEEDNQYYTARTSDSPIQTSPRARNSVQTSDPSKAPSVTSIEDNGEDVSTSQFLERERKPYVAQPGIGKSHHVTSGDEREPKDRSVEQNDLRRTKSVSASQRLGPPPPISVHQRSQMQQPYDMSELTHARTSVEPSDSASFRSRRYSAAGGQPHPFRRTRSNSTSVNEPNTRYHPSQRSPSMTKNGFDFQNPRATAPEVNYGNYQNSTSTSYAPPPGNYQQPSNDRYVYSSRQQSYDPRIDSRYGQRERSRGRDTDVIPRASRQRHQSNAGAEGRPYYDDSYRAGQQGYPPAPNSEYGSNAYQFPPSAYRDNKERG